MRFFRWRFARSFARLMFSAGALALAAKKLIHRERKGEGAGSRAFALSRAGNEREKQVRRIKSVGVRAANIRQQASDGRQQSAEERVPFMDSIVQIAQITVLAREQVVEVQRDF
jgi:hypothetical protein